MPNQVILQDSLHVRHYPRFEVPLTVVSVKHEKRKVPNANVKVLDISEGGVMLNWGEAENPIHLYDTLELELVAPACFGGEIPCPIPKVTGRVMNVSAPLTKNRHDLASAQLPNGHPDEKSQRVNFQFNEIQNWVIPYAHYFSPKPKGLWRVWQQHFPKSLPTIGTQEEIVYPRQIEARICHITNYPAASSAGITRLSLDRWLSQFHPPGEYENPEEVAYEMDCALLRLVEVILLHYYISSERCQDRCKWIYRRLRQRLDTHNFQHPEDHISLSDVRFLPIGKPSKSGQLVQYWFRAISNIPTSLFEERGALPRSPHPGQIVPESRTTRIKKAKLLVFFDDFFGTGDTARGEAIRICEELRARSLLEGKHIAFYALAGTAQATRLLKSTFSETSYLPSDHLFDVAVAGKELGQQELLNDQTSKFRHLSQADLKIIHELCIDNKTLFRDHTGEPRPFGYGNVGSLIVFEHNTPNNTLPILWVESTLRNPLFQRHAIPDFVPGAHPVARTAEQMKWRSEFFTNLEEITKRNQTIIIWGEAGIGKASAVIAWAGKTEDSTQYYKSPSVIGSRLIWNDVLAAYTEDVFLSSVAGFLSARGYEELSSKLEQQSTSGTTASTLLYDEVCQRLQAEKAVICFNGINHLVPIHSVEQLVEKGAERLEKTRQFILRVADTLKGIVPVLFLFDTKAPDVQGLQALSTELEQQHIPYDGIEVKRPQKAQLKEVVNFELAAQSKLIKKSDISDVPDIYEASNIAELANHLNVQEDEFVTELWRVTEGHPLASGLAIGLLQCSKNFSVLRQCPNASADSPCHQLIRIYLDYLPEFHREIVLNAAIFEEPRCRDAVRLVVKYTTNDQQFHEVVGAATPDVIFDLELQRVAMMYRAFLVQLPDYRYGMSDTIRRILLRTLREKKTKRYEESNRMAAHYYASQEDVRFSSRTHKLAMAFQHLLWAKSVRGFMEAAELLECSTDIFIKTGQLRKLEEMINRGLLSIEQARESKMLPGGHIDRKGTYEYCVSKFYIVLDKLCRCTTRHALQEDLFQKLQQLDPDLTGSLNKVRLYYAGALSARWALKEAIKELRNAEAVLKPEWQ